MRGPVWVWGLNYHGPGRSDHAKLEKGHWHWSSSSWNGKMLYSMTDNFVNVRFYMLGIIYKDL
jgi:hypothetical protein